MVSVPSDETARDELRAAVTEQLRVAMLRFAAGLVPQLSNVEIGYALIAIGAGLVGQDLKPEGSIALLRRFADRLEAVEAPPGQPN
jgi:hypothetical protein